MTSDRLHAKYHVARTDGRDRPGCDKADAAYFVLDTTHDPYARVALAAYADACERELPGLAADLRERLAEPASRLGRDTDSGEQDGQAP